MKAPIIKLQNVKKSFADNPVLDNISFEIYPGEFFGIIGASGTGKSTLLNTIIGFLQTDSGDILFRKDSNNEDSPPKYLSVIDNLNQVKKIYGFAAQLPSFYSNLTVFENMDFFGELYGLSKEATLNNINNLLELVELTNARHLSAKNLSGGMQRRLDIACALIHSPSILILDEPTSDLDPVLSKHIWKLLQKINNRGTTIIVASHHLQDMEQICTRIGVLASGKLAHVGSMHEITSTMSKGQEVRIETYPGNYDRILKNLSDPLIMEKENKGNEIVILTAKPDKILLKVLRTLPDLDETLIDVSISRIGLNEVFTKITKK